MKFLFDPPDLPLGEPEVHDCGWLSVTPEEQTEERPYDYLPDLPVILEQARRTGGPILDLACGTGRLSFALAEAGYEVVGFDYHEGFLAHARKEAEGRSPEVRARLSFRAGLMEAFRLERTFPLILSMDQSFKLLLRQEDQLSCLRNVREHLSEGGVFLLTHRLAYTFDHPAEGEGRRIRIGGKRYLMQEVNDPVNQVEGTLAVPAASNKENPAPPLWLSGARHSTWPEMKLLALASGLRITGIAEGPEWAPYGGPCFDVTLVLE